MTKSKRIFVSNRLPFSLNAKTQELVRGSGGLVSALMGVSLDAPFSWFGFETDLSSVDELKRKARLAKPNMELFPVTLDKKLYDSYYDNFSNDVLWPLFHYESQNTVFNREHWNSYVRANQLMAEAILQVAKPDDVVWVHDFHFLLLPKMLKDRHPTLKVGFFLHIPFPSFEIFRQLPVREEILTAMSQCDLIGFHEHSYVRHFSVCLKALMGTDSSFFKAEIGSHTLRFGVYPISIDVESLRQRAEQKDVLDQTQKYRELIKSPFLLLGVDRLDYTKGLELKLKGFRRALQKYPQLQGQVSLLQVAVPTRISAPSYIRLKREFDRLIGTINGEFGQPGYTPVQYIFNSVSEKQLLALYRRANGILITSKRDGMNLVAMEFAISQSLQDGGVLILSEFAGVASLLGQALIINPWDEDAIADAIFQATQMPLEERQERLEGLQQILSRYSATQWARSFLTDLEQSNVEEEALPLIRLGAPPLRWPKSLTRRVQQARKIRLLMDYDGTLVKIARKPEQALLPSNMGLLLQELSENIEIFIVSGRSKNFLDQQFPNSQFSLAAEHGAFSKAPGEEWRSRLTSDLQSWYSDVERVMRAYAEKVPLSFVERKEASLTWHFRQSPPDFAGFQAKKLDDELQAGLANHPVTILIGNKIVEAKATECNKGIFVRSLMQTEEEPSLYICMGDDRTDEDMFRALGQEGVSIKIGTEDTAAHYQIRRQEEVMFFLRELLQVIQGRPALNTPGAPT
ncbi:MAG: bifunctional alpha,alpha-trehalose-phosphate synthase (UDP-forming)/trehalose-phosphatase [Bdellovibrionales bacterium]